MTQVLDRALVRFAWRSLRRSRKLLFAGLVSLVPLAVGLILFANDASTKTAPPIYQPQFTQIAAALILRATVPFTALLLAGGLLADEAEDRTLTYLLVRPIPRRVLYASKAVPVLAATAALGGLQALSLGVLRLLAAFTFGATSQVPYLMDTSGGQVAPTIGAPLLVLRVLPSAMAAAALLGALLAAVFGMVSLLTTRFHFIANLLLYAVWELPFSALGGLPSYGTATYWALSLLGDADPTIGHVTSADATWWIAIPWLAAWAAAWVWFGMKAAPRKSFNITSAAS